MPQYILLSISPNLPPEQVIGADLTPELIQTIIQKYNDWTAKIQRLDGAASRYRKAERLEQAARRFGQAD